MNRPKIQKCPECDGDLDEGFLQAPSFGICWTADPNMKWGFMLSSKLEKLQKDWWGFPRLSKDKLPATRCRKCKLVVFRYTADEQK
ncbi:PF20097 family protein [Candidatus Sumerlaeota bacterium]